MAASLLERAANADAQAFKECVDQFGGLVWSLARRHCTHDADAEDAVQEIFIELWRSAGRYDPGVASEKTFVAMIARRRLIDRYRRRAARPDTDAEPLDTELVQGRAPATESGAEVGGVVRVLAQLSDEQRTVLVLSIYEHLSHGEISERLGMPLGTVKSHARRGLMRAREILREDLEPEAAAGDSGAEVELTGGAR